MNRKKFFGKSLTFLIVGVLAVLAFVRGQAQTWSLVGVFAVWAVWTAAAALRSLTPRIKAAFENRRICRTCMEGISLS